jgi:hypothetical protein
LVNIFQDIPVTNQTEATLEIGLGKTSRVMDIDYDGDGTIDEEKNPDESEIISTSLTKGFSWGLIVGIAGASAAVGLITYLFVRRRRRTDGGSTPPMNRQ